MDHSKKYDKIIQFKQFLQKLYGVDEDTSYSNIMSDFGSKLTDFVNANPGVDFDIQVNVKYRLGQMKKGKGVTKYLKGKNLESSLESEFEIDEDATAVDVVVRLVYINNNNKYTSRNKSDILFETKIIIGNYMENRATDKTRQKYGVRENDMLLTKGQVKKSKLLKLKPVTYNVEQ